MTLLGYAGAQILSFDEGRVHEIAYEEPAGVRIIRRIMYDPDRFVADLFGDKPQDKGN